MRISCGQLITMSLFLEKVYLVVRCKPNLPWKWPPKRSVTTFGCWGNLFMMAISPMNCCNAPGAFLSSRIIGEEQPFWVRTLVHPLPFLRDTFPDRLGAVVLRITLSKSLFNTSTQSIKLSLKLLLHTTVFHLGLNDHCIYLNNKLFSKQLTGWLYMYKKTVQVFI